MQRLVFRSLIIIASIAATAILFQNCGKNFSTADDQDTSGISTLGSSADHSVPLIAPVSTKIEAISFALGGK